MRFQLCFLLLLACLSAHAQQRQPFLFLKDSVEEQRPKWVFVDGDRPEYAAPQFDDSGMPEVGTMSLKSDPNGRSHFKGIGWLRLHFRLDTALAARPLAVLMSHPGASELYLDGVRLFGRGTVGDSAHAVYYDPQLYPLAMQVGDTAIHLLAIRYANWNYDSKHYLYAGELPGFQFRLLEAQRAIDLYNDGDDVNGVFSCVMFGCFVILCILHFLFFLYYRQERSNLWFSLLAGSISILLLLPYILRTATTPKALLVVNYYTFFIVALACFALSGLMSCLFSRKPLRFRIVSGFYLLACVTYIIAPELQGALLGCMIVVATIEAIVIIIRSMIRKVPGAGIIGAGLGVFFLTILIVIAGSLFRQSLNFQFSGVVGLFVLGLLCIILLSIPISLSAYLAFRFAHVSRSLSQRLLEVEALSARTREQEEEKQRILEQQNEVLERQVSERTAEVLRQKGEIERQHAALLKEKKKSDDLLLNILPAEVAEELKQKGSSVARQYEEVTVLFTDIVNFTHLAEKLEAQELVQQLNECFTAFDAIIEKHGLQKIKTIGDAYMAVCGLPVRDPRHAHNTVLAALEIRALMADSNQQLFQVRIGVNCGPVVAGIIGVKKFAYDIWGDTVNTAARMEQHSEPGRINISSATYALVKDAFVCTARGMVQAKNKGEVEMYFVEEAR